LPSSNPTTQISHFLPFHQSKTRKKKEMLAVFDNTVAKCPDALQSPHSAPASSALKDGFLANHFASQHPGSVTVNLGTSGLISHSVEKQNPFLPRYFFPFKIVTHVFVLVSLVDFWD
jgi:hypothetical protein